MAEFPTLAVRAAWTTDPLNPSPVYTPTDGSSSDMTPRFTHARIRHHRQHSLAQFERAVADFEFWNNDRRLDPKHTTGPYGTNVRPRKVINLRATYASTTYDIFTGYLSSIEPEWRRTAKDRFAQLSAADAFKIFHQTRLRVGFWPQWAPQYNPRAFYRMNDENGSSVMKDSAPTPHDGSYTGRNKVTSAGTIKTDPTDSSLNCGNKLGAAVGPVAAGLDNVTESPNHAGVAAWVRMTALPASGDIYTVFAQTVDSGSGAQFAVRITDAGKLRLNIGFDVYDTTASVPVDGNFHLVAVMHYSSTVLMVIDQTTQTFISTPITMNKDVPHIGELVDGTKAFNGSIDEVAVFVGSMPQAADLTGIWDDVNFGRDLHATDSHTRMSFLFNRLGFPWIELATPAVHQVSQARAMDTTFLAHMHEVMRTEGGLFFVRGNGVVRLEGEQPTSAPASTVTFGTGSGERRYREAPRIEYTDESSMLINEVTVTAPGFPDVFKEDTASQTAYGQVSLNHATLFTTRSAMDTRATRILDKFKSPKIRAVSVTLDAADDPTNNIPVMLGTLLGATVTVKTPEGDSIVSQITGREHDLTPERWRTTFTLEPW